MVAPRLIHLVVALLLLGSSAFASPQSSSTALQPQGRKAIATQETPEAKQRRLVLEHVHTLSARLASLPDTYQKLSAMADLGRELCKYDAAEARQVFLQARDSFLRWQAIPHPEIAPHMIGRARELLRQRAAACDASLAAAFPPRTESGPPVSANVQQAVKLLASVAQAKGPAAEANLVRQALNIGGAEFWQTPRDILNFESAETMIASAPVRYSVFLMAHIREMDPAKADELFLTILAQVRVLPRADPDNLVTLGEYLFGSPRRNNLGPSTQPPVARPDLVKAYLNVVIDLLLREPEGHGGAVSGAALRLLPKARQYLPDRAVQLESLTQPGDSQTSTAVESAQKPDPDAHEYEKTLEALAPDERDARYLILVSGLARAGKFKRAREVAEKIEKREPRAALQTFIDFSIGAQALEKGDVDGGLEVARHLPPGAERAALLAGIASACAKTDKQLARETAFAALPDAEIITDGRRPYIKLAIAGVLAGIDTNLALEVLRQAVVGFNQAAQSDRPDAGAQAGGFGISVSAGPEKRESSASFSYETRVAGGVEVSGDIVDVVKRLAERDLEHTESVVLTLTDDSQLAPAISVLAAAWLLKLAPSPAAKAGR